MARAMLNYRGPNEGTALKMSVSEVIEIAKRFLVQEAGFDSVKISSVVAIEGEASWKVTAEIGQPTTDRKEIVVDDRDGKIISYKQA
jgi:ribosomal protein L21